MQNEAVAVYPLPPAPALALHAAPLPTFPDLLPRETSSQLARMFRDPRVLDDTDRKSLIAALRQTVAAMPNVAEVRVLLGMALCVDLRAQEALEQLRTAAAQAPRSFIAHLKLGELLMRLRICDQAEEETHKAALLAGNLAQSELARRQAATIRTMRREGVERGGYQGLIARLFRTRSASTSTQIATAVPGGD
ncbi:MAG TPA: hypothetical protein VHB77_19795 [Planctomycetaceae bacterium]|nr:hypothetical protein [Planctomycetaceae bacterium]